jgi:hypothetical protein
MLTIKLEKEAKAWLRRKKGPDEIIRVIPAIENYGTVTAYHLYPAFEENPDCLGSILFDRNGYWIYDGDVLTISEQEQLAEFIINYRERM